MNRGEILDKAKALTMGDRQSSYGPPVEAHQRIAIVASIVTGKDLDALDIAQIMMAVKMVRMIESPNKADNYVDLAAYAGIAWECADDKPK